MRSDVPASAALEPVIIIIFGITGDLAQRKLLPALYHLLKDGALHPDSIILGITRRDVSTEELLSQVELCVNEIDKVCDPLGIERVASALRMHQMSLVDSAEYDELLTLINDIETEKGICLNRLYFLSIPPQMFEPIVRNLGQHGHNRSCQHDSAETRLLVEKPFGFDLASAQALIDETGEWFREDQLFRIDHYVAKETVQNILAFRMFNPLFSAIWNRNHIAAIEITAAESISIEGRAIFYEGVGALRDFIQNHLLQLVAIATMDLPGSYDSDAIHASKQALLESITPIQSSEVATRAVRGQYEGYRAEVGSQDTATETYAALELRINTPRWEGVPVVVRTGKALARKHTEIRIRFARAGAGTAVPNELVFQIQPGEGISLHLNAKKPGFSDELLPVEMDFNYDQSFESGGHPDAYERVLVDAARGDHTLFTTSQEVIAAWRIVENVLRAWEASAGDLVVYPKGSTTVGKL